MPDRNQTPRAPRQVRRHTTDTAVPASAARLTHRAAAAVARQDAITRIPTLPLDEGNAHPPMPQPPTGDHNVHQLAADDTKSATGTGQPDEDDKDKDKEERGRVRRADEDDQDANSKADDGGEAKKPNPDDEKPSDAKG